MRHVVWFLNNLEEIIGGAAFVVIVITVFLGVIFRYLLNNPIPWTIELATIAFVWVVFIGSSAAIKREMHIGIDAITRLLPKRVQDLLAVVVYAIMLWLLWFFMESGLSFSLSAWLKITPVFKLPYTFVDLAVPVGATLMAIRLVQQIVVRLQRAVKGHEPAPVQVNADSQAVPEA